MPRASDPPSSKVYTLYKLAVYSNLFTGIVYGEGQETCRYLSNL
jgi:hypothetical protein